MKDMEVDREMGRGSRLKRRLMDTVLWFAVLVAIIGTSVVAIDVVSGPGNPDPQTDRIVETTAEALRAHGLLPEQSNHGLTLILVVSQSCPTCRALLEASDKIFPDHSSREYEIVIAAADSSHLPGVDEILANRESQFQVTAARDLRDVPDLFSGLVPTFIAFDPIARKALVSLSRERALQWVARHE